MSLTQVFKALADPIRRQILRMLAQGDLSAGEIAAGFSISKPSVSHHLAVLKQAGLVEDRREGQHIIYSLDTTVFAEVMAWVMDLVGAGEAPATSKEDGAGRSDHGEGSNHVRE
ncbi:autorepressor SdpR family transcription factor [Limnochorda pilosa]|uniref:autorepressor SdpR family transcription factor n=1 Tax=Limnochorda pilosa TaxID=1555112 RepID=UPI0026E9DDBE|nr:autorepressor SdpR family transcription factor [Limnochorda pilosa]